VQVPTDPSRLADLSSNHRWTWWTQAWSIFRADPLGGTGAGTYELARRPIREDTLGPIDPHNLVLKALAETGIVGLLLLLGAVAAAVRVAVGALRRTVGEEHAAAAALVAGGAAWLVHALVDMPWEYAAATLPVTFGLGVLATAGRPAAEPAPAARSAVVLPATVALVLVGSLAFPWLAERRLSASLDALTEGDARTGLAAAQDAAALDPLSVEPLLLEGTAYELADRPDDARGAYERAVRLQPRNPDTWYALGRFEYEQGDLERALLYLDRSWGLDRQSPETGPLLDRVREELSRSPG
jgi:tetratricopeptide (TPR) repeat protein